MDVMQTCFYCLVILLSYLHTAYAPKVRLTLSQTPKDVQTGQDVELECKVADKEIDWTEWQLPDGTIASHNCTKIAENKPYLGLTCDTTGPDELFQLDISAVDHVRDDGVYTCIHNGTTETITLDVHVPVTEVNKSEDVTVPIDGTQELMCVTNCAHPDPIISWTENTNPVTLVPAEEIENCDGTKLNRTRSRLTVPWNANATSSVFECCSGLANNALDTCQTITVSYEQVPTTTQPQTTTDDANGDSTTTNQGTQPEDSTTTVDVTQPEDSTTTVDVTQPEDSTTTVDDSSATTKVAGHLVVALLSVSTFLIFN